MSNQIRAEIWKRQSELANAVSSTTRTRLQCEIEELRAQLNPGSNGAPAHANPKPVGIAKDKEGEPAGAGYVNGLVLTIEPVDGKKLRKAQAARMREARKSAGWSSGELSKVLGYGRNAVSVMECDGYGSAKVKAISFLRINPAWVETGEGERFLGTPPVPLSMPKEDPKDIVPAVEEQRRPAFLSVDEAAGKVESLFIQPQSIELMDALRLVMTAVDQYNDARKRLKDALDEIGQYSKTL